MNQISIIGAAGLTGRELLDLLNHHPSLDLVHVTSDKVAGKKISEVFPDLRVKKDLTFQKHSDSIPTGSLVVLAVPNEVSLEMAPKLLEKGHKIVDLSGAYRLHDKEVFEKYYSLSHTSFHLMDKVVFGLPELFREQIKKAEFVSNPGCYPTSVILPIAFLGKLRKEISGRVIIDSKSGVSGAGGRTEDVTFTFTNTYENFRAYKILEHQHTPEMQEYAFLNITGTFTGGVPEIVFTPHLLPLYRGILSTIVVQFSRKISAQELEEALLVYKKEPFVRFYSKPENIELKKVQKTNYIDISYKLKDDMIVIVSAIDNLVKGAAGQALQNINLMLGLDETLGLK